MNNNSDNVNGGFVNPVDKFEEAFMSCLSALTKEDPLTNVDRDEIRVDVEQGINSVIENARAMESYFLKKRLEIAAQKPELLVKDDSNELRMELIRKDELLKKNYEKIAHWQSILSETTPSKATTGSSQQLSQPQHSLQQQIQSPMTPTGGRPNTPGGAGRPQTPGSAVGARMQSSTNVGFPSPIPQIGSPQVGAGSGLQGPLAFLEKTASGIGMGDSR